MPTESLRLSPILSGLIGLMAALWFALTLSQASRLYFLVYYSAVPTLTPHLEPFGASLPAILFSAVLSIAWAALAMRRLRSACQRSGRAILWMAIALLPAIPWACGLAGWRLMPATLIEVIWLAGWTGLSFGELVNRPDQAGDTSMSDWLNLPLLGNIVVPLACTVCGLWWLAQASWYYHNFLLGYNDFGHFLQRLSNTLAGRGLLIETPVLPRFWDHFNPGLLGLLPLWYLWPDVHQAFAWQSLALAGSGILIHRLALVLNIDRTSATVLSLAWLAQPTLGQMNLAYTYGWHPITFAIPLLLGTLLALVRGRLFTATACCAVALSVEESVFVIVCFTALACAAWQFMNTRQAMAVDPPAPAERLASAMSWTSWLMVGLITAVGFVLVYQFSGLGRFQTGRFISLGSTTSEVLLSPVLRPTIFWGSLFYWDRWIYLLLLWIPCGLPSLMRGRFYLLPTLVPLAVLLVWNHMPAHSIAFQYASTLLPLFWFATLAGAAPQSVDRSTAPSLNSMTSSVDPATLRYATTALISGLVLSLFVGQLPFSSSTTADVDGQTYGNDNPLRRRATDEDGQWLHARLAEIRKGNPRCLATGRIAAHLVNMADIETVGQFLERQTALNQLEDRRDRALAYYQWIILDRREKFQQQLSQTQSVQQQAQALGFRVVAEQYDFVILHRDDHSQ